MSAWPSHSHLQALRRAARATALALSTRVLAISSKRFDRPLLGLLVQPELQSLLEAPDQSTWTGRRDALLWELLYRTGGRISELVALNRQDVQFSEVDLVQLHGKGRKQRAVVLHQATAAWLQTMVGGAAHGSLHSALRQS